MITRIEIKNFQSHANTIIDFDKGVNVLCGESDNGKTAVIRAIKWVAENRPLGTDKLNSSWNRNFKEEMSVTLFLDNGDWVKRIRTKDRNGYSYCSNGSEVDLNATGTDVPQIVKDLLKFSDVNFQFQMDPPYLLSMTPGNASAYLNKIVHLDSIDNIMSQADSNKRSLSSEQKVVEKDVTDLETKLSCLDWVDDAEVVCSRVERLDQMVGETLTSCNRLSELVGQWEKAQSSFVDLSEANALVKTLEQLPDLSEQVAQFAATVEAYEKLESSKVDLSECNKTVSLIEELQGSEFEEFARTVETYSSLEQRRGELEDEIEELKESLPKVCPLCGAELKGDDLCL